MSYFNYHATIKKLIKENKLVGYYFCQNYKGISPALVLIFNDIRHPTMPVREHKFHEYLSVLPKEKLIKKGSLGEP